MKKAQVNYSLLIAAIVAIVAIVGLVVYFSEGTATGGGMFKMTKKAVVTPQQPAPAPAPTVAPTSAPMPTPEPAVPTPTPVPAPVASPYTPYSSTYTYLSLGEPSCTDSDGQDIFTRGKTDVVAKESSLGAAPRYFKTDFMDECIEVTNGFSYKESCSGSNCFVREVICDGTAWKFVELACQNGCKLGACSKEPISTPAPTVTPTPTPAPVVQPAPAPVPAPAPQPKQQDIEILDVKVVDSKITPGRGPIIWENNIMFFNIKSKIPINKDNIRWVGGPVQFTGGSSVGDLGCSFVSSNALARALNKDYSWQKEDYLTSINAGQTVTVNCGFATVYEGSFNYKIRVVDRVSGKELGSKEFNPLQASGITVVAKSRNPGEACYNSYACAKGYRCKDSKGAATNTGTCR